MSSVLAAFTQEESDYRFATELQEKENAAALQSSVARIAGDQKSTHLRTGRSGAATRLAAMRDKDHGKQKMAHKIHNKANVANVNEALELEHNIDVAQVHRTIRSGKASWHYILEA